MRIGIIQVTSQKSKNQILEKCVKQAVTAQDAFLFAQINNGNVASLPLGLNWGWCGELNCSSIIDALFKEKWGRAIHQKMLKESS